MSTMLVVDDDADTCHNMVDLFTDLGFTIDTAESGDVALEKARQRSYDLGLLDLRMPGMDGLTLCLRLKQLRLGMATLIVTAYGNGLDSEARAAGARQVVAKPIVFSQDCWPWSEKPWRGRISQSGIAGWVRVATSEKSVVANQ
jgi:CheY-like chemotaxis protein